MSFDAVVIGAGPAGAVTARELARRGAAVLLVDKARFPRPKVCGCCVNGAAVATLKRLGLGGVLANGIPLRAVHIAAGRRSASVKLPGGVSLSREAFDAALVSEAVNAGAQFRDGVTARLEIESLPHIERPGIGILLRGTGRPTGETLAPEPRTENTRFAFTGRETGATGTEAVAARITARVAIAASGLNGPDATPDAGSRIGAGVTVPADPVPAFFANGTIFMATGRGGYVGLVRVEDGRLDVAAAFDVAFVKACGGPGPAAEAVLGEVGWPRVPGLAELPWKGTPALTRRAKALGGDRWFAVGDSAGYVEPFTGEGMAWAVMSAAALAPIAARAVHTWDGSLLREWEAAHRRTVGTRQRACRVVSRVLRSPTLTTIAVRALAAVPLLSRPVVSGLNRPSPLGARV